MKYNEGTADRIIRIVIGVFGISLLYWGPKSLWGLFGLLPLITGVLGWCPLYVLFGISTCKKKEPSNVEPAA